jgi:hypothetical protein
MSLTPGEVLTIMVGGAAPGLGRTFGGFNGGGGAGLYGGTHDLAGGGGGATDVRRGGQGLSDRVLVAGGGGGGGSHNDGFGPSGGWGGGGGDSGSAGQDGALSLTGDTGGSGGGPGGPTAGGAAGAPGTLVSPPGIPGSAGQAGSFGTGGNPVDGFQTMSGGGGGGWYGGGSGGTGAFATPVRSGAGSGGGGGGSSHVDPARATLISLTEGANAGHGRVVITYEVPDPPGADEPPQQQEPPRRQSPRQDEPAQPPSPAPATPRPAPHPAGLAVRRARIDRARRLLDLDATISDRASGTVTVDLHAARRHHRRTAPIRNGRIRLTTRIPHAQAALGTGILTITYPGDETTRPQRIRLRVALRPARLTVTHATLEDGHLRIQGTIDPAARGVVHLRLHHTTADRLQTLTHRAPITSGTWTLDTHLAPEHATQIANRTSTVDLDITYTGHMPKAIRGEATSLQVLPLP